MLRRILDYVRRSWLMKASVGPTRLSVSGRRPRPIQRTNNGVESFHNIFRQLVNVSHPSFYAFFGISAGITLSNVADVQRLNRGRQIRRPKKKANLKNNRWIRSATAKYSSGSCTVTELLRSVSHCCDVCLKCTACQSCLSTCGHATFCQQCIDTLVTTNSRCPVCRGAISSTVRFYN